MNDRLTAQAPRRPLLWSDAVLDLGEWLAERDDPVYLVGGAVRDALSGRPIHDVDLVLPRGATSLARRIADRYNGDVFILDAERDVARALITTPEGRLNIDVAAFRAEDLLADLQDRDFTVNAMAVDLRGDLSLLIDPLDGQSDLYGRMLRRCAEDSIRHDPIRALRAVRQSVSLGLYIEPETRRDVREAASLLAVASQERVRDEVFKLLDGSKPSAALRIAVQLGLMNVIFPELSAATPQDIENALTTTDHMTKILNTISTARTDNSAATFGLGMLVMGLDVFRPQLQAHIAQTWPNDRSHRALLHLAAFLLPTVSAGRSEIGFAENVAERLRLSNPEKARLAGAWSIDDHPILSEAAQDRLMQHRYWFKRGDAGTDATFLTLAASLTAAGTRLDQDVWIILIERAQARHGCCAACSD
jgi:tRNA nucleotidyltransferase/poly(A) polymerase